MKRSAAPHVLLEAACVTLVFIHEEMSVSRRHTI